jgi:hypothetical protein
MLKKSKSSPELEDILMSRILEGKIRMKPKWWFLLGSLLTYTGIVISVSTSIILVQTTLFALRRNGFLSHWRLDLLQQAVPWWLPLIAVGGTILGIWLLRKYSFGYKQNLKLLALLVVTAVIAAAIIVEVSGMSAIWERRGPMRGLYRQMIYYPHAPNFSTHRCNNCSFN